MVRVWLVASFAALLALGGIAAESSGQEPRSGSVTGELKARKDSRDGKNVVIEVLAPGEEKARSYHVQYDPQAKGPIPDVLEAVRAAAVGDTVEFDWVATGHGPAITRFQVLRRAAARPRGLLLVAAPADHGRAVRRPRIGPPYSFRESP